MKLSYTGVQAPAGLRQHAAFKPCRPELRSRRRVIIRSEASKSGTMRLGGTTKSAGGLGDLLGTITRTIGTIGKAAPKKGPKDQRTVFLAGATGRLGGRVLRELLNAGFKVRAGARDVDAAKASTDIAVQFGLISPEQLRNLSWVEFDLEKSNSMAAAIGNASRVVCAVGAPESATLDSSAPRRIDGDGSIALIEAAASSGVEQFVLVTSLGTGKFGFPAAALNLFWGVLTQKRRAEEALERSGMNYCIVRPGGMERPKDDYKNSHNLVLKPRDSTFGGQVSRLQVAELITAAVLNPDLASNKCLELVAETTAPERSLAALLESLPTEITKEEQEQLAEIEAEAKAELEAAQAALAEANEVLAISADKVAQLSDALKEAKANEKEVRGEAAGVLREGAAAKRALDSAEAAAEKASREEAAAKAVYEAAKKAGAAGELLSAKELQEIARQALQPPKAKEEPARAASPFGLFGAKPAAAPAQQEKREEAPAPSRPASPFGALFAPKQAAPVEEEEEEEVEEVEEVEVARPASPFAALFGGRKQQQVVKEEEEEEEEEVAEEEPAPARAASPFAAFFGAPKPKEAPAAAPAAAAAAKEEPKKPEAAKPRAEPARPASPFAALFGGGGATLQVGDETKIQVPDRPEGQAAPARKPEPAPAPVAPATAAARAAPAPADAGAAAAAEAKRKAAVEEAKAKLQKEQEAAAAEAARKAIAAQAAAKEEAAARERAAAAAAAAAAAEAEALANIKREREAEAKKAAEAKAKAEAEARAKAKAEAEAAAKAAAEKAAAARAKVEAEQKAAAERLRAEMRAREEASKPVETPKPAPAKTAQAPKAAAPAAPKPAAAATDEVAPNVAEARAWIAAWRAKQTAGGATSSSNAAAAPPAAAARGSSSNNNGDVPANVQEARQWIANWRAKQQGGDSSGSGPSAQGQTEESAKDEDVRVIDAENIFASVGKLFGGFGQK